MNLYINGYGSLSAAGATRAARERYAAGEPTWSVDPETGLPVYRIGARPQVPGIAEFIARTEADRTTELALFAAHEAVKQAGWAGKEFAVLVGCSRGPTGSWETGFTEFQQTGDVHLRTSPRTTLGSIGFGMARYFGVSSLADSLSVTCSSGMHAILHGVALLRAGMVDRVLVGGTEAPLTPFTLRQLKALRVYAELPGKGEHACRPLATPASGMVMGEGAAFLALSRENVSGSDPVLSAVTFAQEQQRSATGISAEGQGLQRTMQQAVALAGHPDRIIAHAPGTPRGDAAERAAIAAVFGEDAPEVKSYKWATGHTFGASGPLGIVAALAEGAAGTTLVNATGFGGNVVSVAVSRLVP